MVFYSPERIITDFVKTVSKNGQLLFNITPKSNGDIPQECVHILTEMGSWLERNGEGIYSTRPWLVANENENLHFTASKDGSSLYAFSFDIKGEELNIQSLATGSELGLWKVEKVIQLSTGKKVSFQ